MKNRATKTCAFFGASTTPSDKFVWRKRWKRVAATNAVYIGCAKPVKIGSSPLLRGKKAPPQPPIAPQKMGPNTAISKSLGAMAAPAALVSLVTTDARIVSYKTMRAVLRIPECSMISLKIGTYICNRNEIPMAIGYASVARATGIALIKIGTNVPPPVHWKIIETNLYEGEASRGSLLHNLQPVGMKVYIRQQTISEHAGATQSGLS